MRALIISTGGYLDKRLERILTINNIKGDIAEKLTRNMMNVYDCVIFSHKNDIPNLPKVLEMIVLEKKVQVFYINNTAAIGQFYNMLNDIYFNVVYEMTMEIELPLLIKSNTKYLKHISILERKNEELKDELELMILTKKAKLVLMKKGLNEADSHKFIQQKAMSMRIPKKKLVNLIIENKIDI